MNKKLVGAILGTFVLGGINIASAEDAPGAPKAEKKAKGKGKGGKDKKGGDAKSCSGADGKGCSGAK